MVKGRFVSQSIDMLRTLIITLGIKQTMPSAPEERLLIVYTTLPLLLLRLEGLRILSTSF